MTRIAKPASRKPLPPSPRETRDPVEVDPSYGESVTQLLPKRLVDLIARP